MITEETIFRKTCFNRHFELKVAELHRAKLIKIPIYLSVGEEHISAAVSQAAPNWAVFPQHRCHSWFLSYGGDPLGLLKELLGREDGVNKGKGGSASISMKNFFGHSGLLGDQIPIGVGYAHASNSPTVVVCGDAAVEEDYALASFGYAISKKVPVLFLCEDNDLSILTKKEVRRSWDVVNVARGFGMTAYNTEDDPISIYNKVVQVMDNLPALINVHTCRHLWHAGSGCDGDPKWNRFLIFRNIFPHFANIEKEEENKVNELFRLLPEGNLC